MRLEPPRNAISALEHEPWESLLFSLLCYSNTATCYPQLCKDAARKKLSANQESSQEPNQLSPLYWTSQSPELREIHFCCLSPSLWYFCFSSTNCFTTFLNIKKRECCLFPPPFPVPSHDPFSSFLSGPALGSWLLWTALPDLMPSCFWLFLSSEGPAGGNR